jgi:hypothetical protein
LNKIVHICDTQDGWGVYVSMKSYGIAKGMRPFLLCSDSKGRIFKIYLNKDDREYAIDIMHSLDEKLNLLGRYKTLRLAKMIYTEKGWRSIVM